MKRSGEGRIPPFAAAFGAPVRGHECSFGSHVDPPEQQFGRQRSRVYRWRRNTDSSFWPNKLGVSGIGGNLSRRRARRLPAPSRIFADRLPTSAKGWAYNHSSGERDFSCNHSRWTRTLDRSRGRPPNIAASAASRASPISNYRCCRGRSYRQERRSGPRLTGLLRE